MQREHNVGTVERGIRIIGGSAAAIVGIVLLIGGGANTFLLGLAFVALTLLGIDFVVTGVTGYCPLYHRIGWSTAPRKARQV